MPEFALSRFEHWLLRQVRNGGLLSRHCNQKKYEYMDNSWESSGKYVGKSLVLRLEKQGYLREVDFSEVGGAGIGSREYFQCTPKGNALPWQFKKIVPSKIGFFTLN